MRQAKGTGNILAIECAVGRGSVSVLNGPSLLASTVDRQAAPSRAEEVITVINSVLKEAGLVLDDLDLIAVSTGPGSYSGIRIGVATALGLKNSLNIPCVGVSALDAMALFVDHSMTVTCAIPVGKKDIAWEQYKSGMDRLEPLGPPEIGTEQDFLTSIKNDRDLRLFLHSDLMHRLKDQDIPRIQISDAGSNISEMIGLAAASNHGEEILRPIYLRNRAHASRGQGF